MANPAKKTTGAPKAAPKAAVTAAPKKINTVKRNLTDESKKPKIYSIVRGGGVWFKLRQNNITVFDEETGGVRKLRYSPNENSIFADEQSDNIIREQIVFIEKTLTVPYTNPPLSRYLDLHPDNVANGGNGFILIDTSKSAEVSLEKEFETLDAVSMVRDKSIDELLPVAMYLGIDTNQKNMEIKRELLREAKANPARFIEMFDNPVVKVKSTIISAIDFQILKAANDGLKWYDSNRLIVSTPSGQDTIDIATRYCLSEKGAMVLEEIENQLSKV